MYLQEPKSEEDAAMEADSVTNVEKDSAAGSKNKKRDMTSVNRLLIRPRIINQLVSLNFEIIHLSEILIAAPVQRDPRSAPPPAQAPVPSSGGGGGDDQEKQQLIEQVLRLTPEQINQLPEDQKQTILALKKSHGR